MSLDWGVGSCPVPLVSLPVPFSGSLSNVRVHSPSKFPHSPLFRTVHADLAGLHPSVPMVRVGPSSEPLGYCPGMSNSPGRKWDWPFPSILAPSMGLSPSSPVLWTLSRGYSTTSISPITVMKYPRKASALVLRTTMTLPLVSASTLHHLSHPSASLP